MGHVLDDFFPSCIKDRLEKLNSIVNDYPIPDKEIESLLKRTVLAGGKRLRPTLMYLTGNILGLDLSRLDQFAVILEFVHAASLAHDDVIDQATTRRGMPSINVLGSNKKAVLAGDFLLSEVIQMLLRADSPVILTEVSKTIQELSQGEWLQLQAEERREYSREIIASIALKKTARMMGLCTWLPFIVRGEQDAIVLTNARLIGEKIGIAFQLIDDTLDFSEHSQKDNHLDLDRGLVNSVIFEWLDANPDLMHKFNSGESLLSFWHPEGLKSAIDIIRERARGELEAARALLPETFKDIKSRDQVKYMHKIIDYLALRIY